MTWAADAGCEDAPACVTLQLGAVVRASMQKVAHAQAAARTRYDPRMWPGGCVASKW